MSRPKRQIGAFRIDKLTANGELVGSRISAPDGRAYEVPQFPNRIRDVREADADVVLVLQGGSRRRLRETDLVEAATSVVDELFESKLDEALLESAFCREEDPADLETVLREADEAAYRARAESYAGKHGGIGSSERQDIGKGKGRSYPPGFQHIRNALIRAGHSVADASRIAYGALRRWSEGRGNVKSSTRDKARSVLGQLAAGGGAGRVRAGARAAVRESVLQEAANQMEPATRTRRTTLVLDEPVREDGDAPTLPEGGVLLQLPPVKGTLPTVLTEADGEALIGEATVPRALNQTDLVELQEQARDLYDRTLAPTHLGRSYIASAGRVELTQIVAALREAFTPRKLDGVAGEGAPVAQGADAAAPERREVLANGEPTPAGRPHPPEEVAYADRALRHLGVTRDGRSSQGDYLHTVPVAEGEELREAHQRPGVVGSRPGRHRPVRDSRIKEADNELLLREHERYRGVRRRAHGRPDLLKRIDSLHEPIKAELRRRKVKFTEADAVAECYIEVTHKDTGKKRRREMGSTKQAHAAAAELRQRGHKVRVVEAEPEPERVQELPEQAARAAVAELTEARRAKRKACPECGQSMPGFAQKCAGCGHSFHDKMSKDDRRLERHHRRHGQYRADEFPDSHPLGIHEAQLQEAGVLGRLRDAHELGYSEHPPERLLTHELARHRAMGKSETHPHVTRLKAAIARLGSGPRLSGVILEARRGHKPEVQQVADPASMDTEDLQATHTFHRNVADAHEQMARTDERKARFARQAKRRPGSYPGPVADTDPDAAEARANVHRHHAHRHRKRALDLSDAHEKRTGRHLVEAHIAEGWMSGAVKRPGQLHRDLGVPAGEPIPPAKLKAALHSKDPKVRARARLAVQFKRSAKGRARAAA